jgi:hypothetical protein
MLQRVVEFLPIEQLLRAAQSSRFAGEKSDTVKAISRAWKTAARRALNRGRWRPLRTLELARGCTLETGSWIVDPEARSAFDRDAREAWALYPGEILLLLNNCNTQAACDYLSLVVEPTKQGFGSIVAALEKVLQLGRSRTISRHCRGAVLVLLGEWMSQAMPGSLPDSIYLQKESLATPEWLGDALGHWTDPALAVQVVDVLIEYYHEDWYPRYDDLARSMSVNWSDSGKRARFVAAFAQRQAQEDADIATADAEAPHIVDDGMYNHL